MPFSDDSLISTSYMQNTGVPDQPIAVSPNQFVDTSYMTITSSVAPSSGGAASSIVSSPSPGSSSGIPTWMLLAGAALVAFVVFKKK